MARSFGATLVVLFTIAITIFLIRTLNMANRGKVNPEEIMLMLTFTSVAQLPMVLTLALFIAIVSTLSRMYRESEMAIWFNSGRGLASFLAPITRFAWPIWLVIALLALFAWPWAKEQSVLLSDRYERRGDLERVAPGQFQESSDGRRVFFIDKNTQNGQEGRNVFISSSERDGRETITSASRGRVEWVNSDQFLVLNDGQRLEQTVQNAKPVLRISEFEEYRLQIGQAKNQDGNAGGVKAMPTWELIQQPDRASLGELGWRIGQTLTAINFVLLALAIAGGNPRVGKSGNLVFILLAFVVYSNLAILGQGWVTTGKVDWWRFMLGLHGGVMALSMAWIAKRHFNLGLWPRGGARAAGVAA